MGKNGGKLTVTVKEKWEIKLRVNARTLGSRFKFGLGRIRSSTKKT